MEFSSDRKRMSVVVKALDGPRKDTIYVLMKGADDVMLTLVKRNEPQVVEDTGWSSSK